MPPEPEELAGARVLLVEDDEIVRVSVADRLEMAGAEVAVASDCATARALLERGAFDLVLSDIRLPDGDGRALFEEVCRHHPGVPVMLMTGYISVEDAVALTKAGAIDYVTKPFDLEDFVVRAGHAVAYARDLRGSSMEGPGGVTGPAGSGLLARSPAMRRIEEIVARIRGVDSSVLITGESGVGKEVVAAFLHRNSARSAGPFVPVNCAALPLNLVESELFGHERGAFTGAERRRLGRFELAQRGTILLDEIAEVPPETQVKLLRVLQERRLERIGGTETIELDVRVVAATQVDLEAAVRDGRFRADLFWRLNVIRIHVPPLRERREDILFLARRFVAMHAARMGRPAMRLSPGAERRLLAHDYPGNVRELANIVERAIALAAGPEIAEHDLLFDDDAPAGEGVHGVVHATAPLNLRASVEAAERAAILRALDEAEGRMQVAAELLGISRKNLWEKMRRLGIAADTG